ncbi:MAG TPA: hypothetical protein VHD62_05070 [Opitutaceae bacterium]|nr:hypothetical protein [Opitutaceae bacterium]
MKPLRALPLAIVLTLAASAIGASDDLPAIFSGVAPQAPRTSLKNFTAPPAPAAAISERMRAQLTERVRAQTAAPANAKPTAAANETAWWRAAPDAVVMDRYIVNVPPEKKRGVERQMNPVYAAFSTGLLYRWDSGGRLREFRWGLGEVRPSLSGTMSTAPRVELSFHMRF